MDNKIYNRKEAQIYLHKIAKNNIKNYFIYEDFDKNGNDILILINEDTNKQIAKLKF